MAHIATRLSTHVEINATRRLSWDVEKVRTDGGYEVRNARWSQPLYAFDVAYPAAMRDDATYQSVSQAYHATGGGLDSFAFRDWADYQCTDEPFGTGDGTTTVFPLIKSYTFGSAEFFRRIYLPVSAITVKKDGVTLMSGYSVNYSTGNVTLTVAPLEGEELSWTGDFDIPVRFEGDFETTGMATHLEHIETITLQEVRL